ncbi:MAG: NADPH-dependent FMN reductase [Candidatus Latescibacterota bacterium]|jgi:hypothetical protein
MSADDNGLRIAVIKGSVRPGNYTGMAVDLVVEELREKGVEVDVIDPVGMDLKLPGMGDSRSADELQELICAVSTPAMLSLSDCIAGVAASLSDMLLMPTSSAHRRWHFPDAGAADICPLPSRPACALAT